MQLQKVIEQLGYGAHEAKVYLALLSLGESLVTDIANKTKLPRSSVHAFLEKLHRDGLVDFYQRRRYTYWVAEKPSHLLARLHEREEELRAALPRLEAMRHGELGKPRIRVFEGVEEIRLIYEDMLATKQPIIAIIPWADWNPLLGRGFIEDFIEKRIRHFLRLRLLTPKSPVAVGLHSRDSKELRDTRFIPDTIPVKIATFVYGEKAVIVSLSRKMPTGVMIEDPDVCETMLMYFEQLWKQSSSS